MNPKTKTTKSSWRSADSVNAIAWSIEDYRGTTYTLDVGVVTPRPDPHVQWGSFTFTLFRHSIAKDEEDETTLYETRRVIAETEPRDYSSWGEGCKAAKQWAEALIFTPSEQLARCLGA